METPQRPLYELIGTPIFERESKDVKREFPDPDEATPSGPPGHPGGWDPYFNPPGGFLPYPPSGPYPPNAQYPPIGQYPPGGSFPPGGPFPPSGPYPQAGPFPPSGPYPPNGHLYPGQYPPPFNADYGPPWSAPNHYFNPPPWQNWGMPVAPNPYQSEPNIPAQPGVAEKVLNDASKNIEHPGDSIHKYGKRSSSERETDESLPKNKKKRSYEKRQNPSTAFTDWEDDSYLPVGWKKRSFQTGNKNSKTGKMTKYQFLTPSGDIIHSRIQVVDHMIKSGIYSEEDIRKVKDGRGIRGNNQIMGEAKEAKNYEFNQLGHSNSQNNQSVDSALGTSIDLTSQHFESNKYDPRAMPSAEPHLGKETNKNNQPGVMDFGNPRNTNNISKEIRNESLLRKLPGVTFTKFQENSTKSSTTTIASDSRDVKDTVNLFKNLPSIAIEKVSENTPKMEDGSLNEHNLIKRSGNLLNGENYQHRPTNDNFNENKRRKIERSEWEIEESLPYGWKRRSYDNSWNRNGEKYSVMKFEYMSPSERIFNARTKVLEHMLELPTVYSEEHILNFQNVKRKVGRRAKPDNNMQSGEQEDLAFMAEHFYTNIEDPNSTDKPTSNINENTQVPPDHSEILKSTEMPEDSMDNIAENVNTNFEILNPTEKSGQISNNSEIGSNDSDKAAEKNGERNSSCDNDAVDMIAHDSISETEKIVTFEKADGITELRDYEGGMTNTIDINDQGPEKFSEESKNNTTFNTNISFNANEFINSTEIGNISINESKEWNEKSENENRLYNNRNNMETIEEKEEVTEQSEHNLLDSTKDLVQSKIYFAEVPQTDVSVDYEMWGPEEDITKMSTDDSYDESDLSNDDFHGKSDTYDNESEFYDKTVTDDTCEDAEIYGFSESDKPDTEENHLYDHSEISLDNFDDSRVSDSEFSEICNGDISDLSETTRSNLTEVTSDDMSEHSETLNETYSDNSEILYNSAETSIEIDDLSNKTDQMIESELEHELSDTWDLSELSSGNFSDNSEMFNDTFSSKSEILDNRDEKSELSETFDDTFSSNSEILENCDEKSELSEMESFVSKNDSNIAETENDNTDTECNLIPSFMGPSISMDGSEFSMLALLFIKNPNPSSSMIEDMSEDMDISAKDIKWTFIKLREKFQGKKGQPVEAKPVQDLVDLVKIKYGQNIFTF